MKTVLKIVASLVLALAATSCIYEYPETYSGEGGEAASGGKVTLMMNVKTLRTRAGGVDADMERPFERPKYLRVVIVGTDYCVNKEGHADAPERTKTPWKVEVNYRISEDMASGSGGVMDAAGKQLKFPNIEADRKKRIYIFINCEDIEFTLRDGTKCGLNGAGAAETLFGAGTVHNGNPLAEHPYQTGRLPIDDCTYSFKDGEQDYEGLPYVGVYEVDVPSSSYVLDNYGVNPESVSVEPLFTVGPLYLVRAANRIRFEFVNDTAHPDGPDETEIAPVDIDVLGWTLSNIADRAYLMPHLDADWRTGLKNGLKSSLSVQESYYEVKADGTMSGKSIPAEDYYGGAWMLWLKQEAETSKTLEVDGSSPVRQYEWLTGYDVPEGTNHGLFEYNYDGKDHRPSEVHLSAPTAGADGKYVATTELVPKDNENAVYFAESKNSPDADGRQHYRLEVRVRQTNTSGDKTPVYKTYTCEDLPNSLSLFRNTDLLVRVRFRRLRTDGLEMAVDVVPYGSIELDPVFGLEDK